MTTLINCTPHPVHICDESNAIIRTIEPSGIVPRLVESVTDMQMTVDGVPLVEVRYGYAAVESLPVPTQDTYLIVSRMTVDAAAAYRSDLLAPYDMVRDDTGRIIGCKKFAR